MFNVLIFPNIIRVKLVREKLFSNEKHETKIVKKQN